MDVWWEKEGKELGRDAETVKEGFGVLDMAAGSGEVTEALFRWVERIKMGVYRGVHRPVGRYNAIAEDERRTSEIMKKTESPEAHIESAQIPKQASNPHPILHITATDPYTSPAYTSQTKLPCLTHSFRDISNGALSDHHFTHIICSFALHLVTDTSELFSLLWELSSRATWLFVIAPGKRPEIKEGWGWRRWDLKRWDVGDGSEIVAGKCKGRVYRSINF